MVTLGRLGKYVIGPRYVSAHRAFCMCRVTSSGRLAGPGCGRRQLQPLFSCDGRQHLSAGTASTRFLSQEVDKWREKARGNCRTEVAWRTALCTIARHRGHEARTSLHKTREKIGLLRSDARRQTTLVRSSARTTRWAAPAYVCMYFVRLRGVTKWEKLIKQDFK